MGGSSLWGEFSPEAELVLATLGALLLVGLATNAPKVGVPLVAVIALGMAYSAVSQTGG